MIQWTNVLLLLLLIQWWQHSSSSCCCCGCWRRWWRYQYPVAVLDCCNCSIRWARSNRSSPSSILIVLSSFNTEQTNMSKSGYSNAKFVLSFRPLSIPNPILTMEHQFHSSCPTPSFSCNRTHLLICFGASLVIVPLPLSYHWYYPIRQSPPPPQHRQRPSLHRFNQTLYSL